MAWLLLSIVGKVILGLWLMLLLALVIFAVALAVMMVARLLS